MDAALSRKIRSAQSQYLARSEAAVERQGAYAARQRASQQQWRLDHQEERRNEVEMAKADRVQGEWFRDDGGASKAAMRASDQLLAALQAHHPGGDHCARV